MNETAAKLAGLSVILIAVWIGVYWLTPAEPRVTFADLEAPTTPAPAVREAPRPQPAVVEPPARPAPREEPRTSPAPDQSVKQPEVAVVPPEFLEHVIQKDETFESIARKYFGAKASGSIIAKANPFVDPLRLRPGRTIRIPKDPKNIQGIPVARTPETPKKAERQTYVVKSGDSLSKIAAKFYGDSTLATIIFEANRDQLADVDSLKLGQTLIIPEHKPE